MMSRKKIRRSCGAVAAACVLLASGCGGEDSSSDTAPPEDGAVPGTVSTTEPSPAAATSPGLGQVSSTFVGKTIRQAFQFGPDKENASVVIEMLPGQIGPNIIHIAFLDHAEKAVPIVDVQMGLRSAKGPTKLPSTPLQDAGHYAAQVTFAKAGSWEFLVQFQPTKDDETLLLTAPISVQ